MNDSSGTDAAKSPKLPVFITLPGSRWNKIWFFLRIAVAVLLILCFFSNPDMFSKTTEKGIVLYKRKRMLWLSFLTIVMVLLPLFRLKVPKRLGLFFTLAELAVIIPLALVRAEHIQGYKFFNSAKFVIFSNIALALAIFLLIHVVTNSVKWSAFLTYAVIILFSVTNYYVYKFRGEPVNVADLYVVGTALNVADSYSFTLTYNVFFAILEFFLLLGILTFLPKEKMKLKRKARLFYCVVAASCSLFVFWVYTISEWPLDNGVQVKVFKPMKSYRKNCELLNFFRGYYYMNVDKPSGYSKDTVDEIIEDIGFRSDGAETVTDEKNPNIIVVMNESLTDFKDYYDSTFPVNEDPLPYIHSLQNSKDENIITGRLYVDVFGARTANTEYEFMTGNSIAFLPYNAMPFALYIRRRFPSITWNFRDMGYSGNFVFHPYLASGYSRPRAYPLLGFEDFVSLEDIEDTLSESDYINWVSDEANNKKIIEYYEEAKAKSDAPFYIFNVTMQNHGGYEKGYDDFPLDITVGGAHENNIEIQRFVNLTKYSDEAFKILTEYFSNVDEPTVVIMFGDHRPKVGKFFKALYGKAVADLEDEEQFQNYETPLIIWANYDINPERKYDSVFSKISINYLSSEIMNICGLPMTAYQKFLVKMRETIPVFCAVGYMDSENEYYEVDDKDSPYYELISKYHNLIYNYQFDRKNLREDFFCLDVENPSMDSGEQ